MAVQASGITVVSVNNASRVIQFYVGNIEVALAYLQKRDRFRDVYRSYLDGRRATDRIRILDGMYRSMIRQAHAIARDRGWKQ